MKRILQFILILVLAIGQACEGPEGDPGPQGEKGDKGDTGAQGPAGPAGTPATADVYEIGGWNFNAANEFQEAIGFADNKIEVGEDDVVLVYRLSNVFNNKPVWSPLPQNLIFKEGLLLYDFVHTSEELAIFMDGQFDLATLGEGWTTDQAFRIVIAPGTIRNGRKAGPTIDYKNYAEVAKYYQITEDKVKKIKLK